MPASGLVISHVEDATIATFTPTSLLHDADLSEAARELHALAGEQGRRKTVVDFRQVRALSSQVLGVFVALHKKLSNIGGQMVICGLRPDLNRVFRITRLDKILRFASDETKALRLLDVRRQD